MFQKTSDKDHKDHKGSLGILGDLIKTHGADSQEVYAYTQRFLTDEKFMKLASLLVSAGIPMTSVKRQIEKEDKEEKKI